MDNNTKLTREGQYLLSSWKEFQLKHRQNQREEMIKVSETFGFVAHIYEKLRSSVEYRGEHVLRRNTIERMLKRIIWLPKTAEEKAELIIKELTWSRFIPNESLSINKLSQITSIASKYEYLLTQINQFPDPPEKINWEEWILGVASTEIEEIISPSYLRTILSPLMFAWLKKNFIWDTETLSIQDREIQLFIAAQRALAKSDHSILRYRLLLLLQQNWNTTSPDSWNKLAQQLPSLIIKIEQLLNYSQSNLVFRFVKHYVPSFTILNEVLIQSDNPQETITSPSKLKEKARQIIEEKYYKLQSQITTAVSRSIIYLLITKVVIALIIELPYEIFILGHVNYLPISINVIFPPVLMLIIGANVKVPGDNNTKRIINQLTNLLYQSSEKPQPLPAKLTPSVRQKKLSKYFSIFYTIIFLGLVYLTGWILITKLNFNIISTLFFFSFLSLVLLFSYRVRWESQELTVAKHSGGVISHVFSIFAMPFINLGAWLSAGLSQINIFMFILDVIIDAPLKTLVGAIEEWSQFLQRKEAEVVEIPTE